MANIIDFADKRRIKLIRNAIADFANSPEIQSTELAYKLAQLVEQMDLNNRK